MNRALPPTEFPRALHYVADCRRDRDLNSWANILIGLFTSSKRCMGTCPYGAPLLVTREVSYLGALLRPLSVASVCTSAERGHGDVPIWRSPAGHSGSILFGSSLETSVSG